MNQAECPKCGSITERSTDGKFHCANGHEFIESDTIDEILPLVDTPKRTRMQIIATVDQLAVIAEQLREDVAGLFERLERIEKAVME